MKLTLLKEKAPLTELGANSVKIQVGYVEDDYTPALRDAHKRYRVFKEMSDNDPTAGSVLKWIKAVVAGVSWKMEQPLKYKGTDKAKEYQEWFWNAIFNDMDISFVDVKDDILSMLIYGWAYLEIVYKVRKTGTSKYPDNKIGIRKLAVRDQDSLDVWNLDPYGDVLGMTQVIYGTNKTVYIPIDRALHFRTNHNRNNPEGLSLLRNAYTPWFFLKNIGVSEAIGIERNLAGLPVIYLPGELLNSSESADKLVVNAYKKILENMRMNERSGLILPSDTYSDADGNPTNIPKVKLELLSSNSQKVIDTNGTMSRYQNDIARSMLADFIMLGSKRTGSFALSNDKTDMFECSILEILQRICDQFNNKLIPKLCNINGFDWEYAPVLKPGSVSREELDRLSSFLENLNRAGAPVFPDENLENYLRNLAGLPEASPDRLTEQVDFQDAMRPPEAKPEVKTDQKNNV